MENVTQFSGNVPKYYDENLGPVLFEEYGKEAARRVKATPGMKLLEIAAGTGRVSQHLAQTLPADADLTITDLHEDMLDIARSKVSRAGVKWQTADALDLPFSADTFDAVIAQFSVMFYPDKGQGQREVFRVLKPGGTYLFAVWGSHEDCPWAGKLHAKLGQMFPEDPPMFLTVPFGYNDHQEIRSTLERTGFKNIRIEPVKKEMVAERTEDFARGALLGSPMAAYLSEKGIVDLEAAVAEIADALRSHFGDPMRSTLQAIFVSAEKP